jgi:hypothetical protein
LPIHPPSRQLSAARRGSGRRGSHRRTRWTARADRRLQGRPGQRLVTSHWETATLQRVHGEETVRGMAGGGTVASLGLRQSVAPHRGNDSGARWLHDGSCCAPARVQAWLDELRPAVRTLQTRGRRTVQLGHGSLSPLVRRQEESAWLSAHGTTPRWEDGVDKWASA